MALVLVVGMSVGVMAEWNNDTASVNVRAEVLTWADVAWTEGLDDGFIQVKETDPKPEAPSAFPDEGGWTGNDITEPGYYLGHGNFDISTNDADVTINTSVTNDFSAEDLTLESVEHYYLDGSNWIENPSTAQSVGTTQYSAFVWVNYDPLNVDPEDISGPGTYDDAEVTVTVAAQ